MDGWHKPIPAFGQMGESFDLLAVGSIFAVTATRRHLVC